jgi:hypothetical protein
VNLALLLDKAIIGRKTRDSGLGRCGGFSEAGGGFAGTGSGSLAAVSVFWLTVSC